MLRKTLGQIGVLCVCFLTVCALPMVASGAFDSGSQPEPNVVKTLHDESDEWELRVDDAGNNYLHNVVNGACITSCYKYSGNGIEQVNIDASLVDEFNAPADAQVFPGTSEELESYSIEPARIPIRSYIYRETYATQMYGAESDLTPLVKAEFGDALLDIEYSVTYTESFGAGVDYGAEDIIRAGVSFAWNRSASINGGYAVELILPQGKVGYLAFKPLLNVSSGILTTIITDDYYADTSNESVTVSCPVLGDSGFAKGLLYVVTTGNC